MEIRTTGTGTIYNVNIQESQEGFLVTFTTGCVHPFPFSIVLLEEGRVVGTLEHKKLGTELFKSFESYRFAIRRINTQDIQ